MKPKIIKANMLTEYSSPEGCFIFENWGLTSSGDKMVSIARARVEPGVTTKAHHLDGIQEIYLIVKGEGRLYIGDQQPSNVGEGDVAVIPSGMSQFITNTGKVDLIFYCVCTPSFTEDHYRNDENVRK